MKKAIVIVPTYNEHENIQKLIPILLDIFAAVKTWQMHVLVVDDTSPDRTYEVVEQLAKKHKQVHLLLNKQKSGLGGAYLKGMDYAFEELGADVVFEFDADLSHDPTRIPAFLEKLDAGYDMVLGSRYIPGGGIPEDWGWHRKFLSVVGNLFITVVLTDFRIRDWTGGYRALTKEVFNAVRPELQSQRFTGYTFQIGFLYNAVRKGFKITEVPFKFVDRTIGQSKMGPEYIKNTLIYICKARAQEIMNHRIFKFLMVGGLGTVVQFVSLLIFRSLLPSFTWYFLSSLSLANFFAVEVAVFSNFMLNNLWTFSDVQLKLPQIPAKLLQFNIASSGSILIQFIVVTICERLFGIFPIFSLPGFVFDSGILYVMIGIVIGLFWNFFAYNKFIWRGKKAATKS